MSTTGSSVPKVSYAKGRNKSKTKNQAQSQQKISFQGQSSADIFAHLNQDNLNYIKKQLKNKKTSQSHQRAKSSNQVQLNSLKGQEIKINKQQKTVQQIKVYEKYKNDNQVVERDSREQETMRQTQVDDEVNSQRSSIKQQQTFKRTAKENYMGLNPPPSMYKGYKESLPSTQSQHMKTGSMELTNVQRKGQNQEAGKISYLQYELKSQNSNNRLAKSTLSVQNQLSDDMSVNLKASQFIHHLENYIDDLNSSPQKTNNKGRKNKTDELQIFNQSQGETKNFKKNKNQPLQYRLQLGQNIDSFRSQNSQSYRPLSINKNKHVKHTESNSHYDNYRPFSGFQQQNQQQDKTMKMKKNNVSKQKQINPITYRVSQQSNSILQLNLQRFKQQLSKQRYYCTKLALQLQKYKQNQQKYQKQINLLNKTVEILKIQIQNVKELYENESIQTQKIMNFIQSQRFSSSNHKQKHYKQKKQSSSKRYHNSFRNQPQNQHYFDTNNKSINQDNVNKFNFRRKSQSFDFEEFMKVNPSQPIYQQIDSNFTHRLINNFQNGQINYKQNKKNNQIDTLLQNTRIYNKFDQKRQPQNYYNFILNKEPIPEKNFHNPIIYHQKVDYQIRNTSERKKNQKNSLQKLKQEYNNFKAQIDYQKPSSRINNNRSFKQEVSPKQFQIHVK